MTKKSKTKKSKTKNCTRTGYSPLFCNLAEGGRVIFSVVVVLSVLGYTWKLYSGSLYEEAKEFVEEERKKQDLWQLSQEDERQLEALIQITSAGMWIMFVTFSFVMWWLVQKFDIIAVVWLVAIIPHAILSSTTSRFPR